MERIYHPFNLWEDYKAGFYDNCSGSKKAEYKKECLKLFNNLELLKEQMLRVVNEWKYSCEHNLTNPSMNKIAYIGQGAACIYKGIPNTVTMECWSLLSKEVQKEADKIAEVVLNEWENKYKINQLCLNFD